MKSTLPILALLSVIPAQAGIQFSSSASWIPVYTGMTIRMIYCSDPHGRPHLNAVRDISSRVGRPFRKVFTSPEGEGFAPSPKETLKEMTEGGFGFHGIWENLIQWMNGLDIDRIKKKAGIR